MNTRHAFTLAAAVAVGIAATTATASAQTRVDTIDYSGPDRGLLRSGVWTLGLGYVPALVVGIESPLRADRYLLVPVAGPWIDFARRECDDCSHEGLNKFLLAADGVVQGVGALEIVGSFLFLEHSVSSPPARTAKADQGMHLRFKPKRVAGGYSLTAIGNF